MKALISDIKARIKDPITTEELSDLLFQLGHENNIQNNIIDIDITPNRGDCLSLLGILRDLKNFYEIDTKYETHEEILDSFNLNFFNEGIESCPNISFLKIEIDETISDYKEYLESKKYKVEINIINEFNLVKNYQIFRKKKKKQAFTSIKKNLSYIFMNFIPEEHKVK